MITDPQSHVAAIAPLSNVLPFPEDPVAPRWNTTLLTATEAEVPVSRYSLGAAALQGRTLLSQTLFSWHNLEQQSKLYFPQFLCTVICSLIVCCEVSLHHTLLSTSSKMPLAVFSFHTINIQGNTQEILPAIRTHALHLKFTF